MANRVLFFVDRLAERGLVDRWGFLSFAFGGAGLILAAKGFGAPPIPVAVAAAGAIVAYAVLVQRSGTGRLRGDQAGDNCYYLGLIYTLTSLAYAIFVFDPADTATTIIQGFGVALTTTIMGLVLRVYFNQSRTDLVEVEDTARLELAQATGRLKTELSNATVSMNDFGRQTRQSLEELRAEVLSSLKEVQESAARAIAEAAAASSAAVAQQADETVSRAKRISTATDKIVGSIERHVASLSEVEKAQSAIATGMATVEQAAQATSAMMEGLTERAAELQSAQSAVSGTISELNQVATQLLDQVRALDATATRFDQLVVSRLDEVRAVPQEIAAGALAGVEAAVHRLRDSLEGFAATQGEVARELVQRAEDTVATASRHNAALETELAKSRDNVAKVHSALVDMTGQLADRLEEKVA